MKNKWTVEGTTIMENVGRFSSRVVAVFAYAEDAHIAADAVNEKENSKNSKADS